MTAVKRRTKTRIVEEPTPATPNEEPVTQPQEEPIPTSPNPEPVKTP